VILSPLGTSATSCPIVPAQYDRWWMWISQWSKNWQGKPKYSEKTCPSAILSTTNPTLPDLGWNPGCRSRKPTTNHLSYGMTSFYCLLYSYTLKMEQKYSTQFRQILTGLLLPTSFIVAALGTSNFMNWEIIKRRGKHIGYLWGSQKERAHYKDQDVGGWLLER
jgi:hypothetical protein